LEFQIISSNRLKLLTFI